MKKGPFGSWDYEWMNGCYVFDGVFGLVMFVGGVEVMVYNPSNSSFYTLFYYVLCLPCSFE